MKIEKQILLDEWPGLYSESWKGVIVDDAFAHPAKFSRALIRKIYDHVIAEGWVKSGDRVIDPFGGVALGGFDAMRHGLNWFGCELEARFVALGTQNIALWNERFSRMPNWGTAQILQGDSRKLTEVLGVDVDACVSSPPYVLARQDTTKVAPTLGHIYGEDEQDRIAALCDHRYGQSEGQLGAMKEGDHSIVISSPPYVSGGHHNDIMGAWNANGRGQGVSKDEAGYGKTDGQLGAMPEGKLCVSSPPWEKGAEGFLRKDKFKDPTAFAAEMYSRDGVNGRHGCSLEARIAQIERDQRKTYGDTEGQMGQQSGETFWSASRLILEQLHQVLAPNAHAVFVVKAFVRNKQIVDFPAQWAQLCEAVGFKLLHDHHALLTEHYGTQGGFEGDKKLSVERKSFFRRLAESKGSPRIDYENVLCFRKI